jgi:hypothetical protein
MVVVRDPNIRIIVVEEEEEEAVVEGKMMEEGRGGMVSTSISISDVFVRRGRGWEVVGTRAGIVVGEVVVMGMGMGIVMVGMEVEVVVVGIIEGWDSVVDMRAA